MVFGDFFNGSFGSQRLFEDKISISKEEFETLKAKAERFDELEPFYKKVQAKNDRLTQELLDLKEDGRKLKDLRDENEKYLKSLLQIQADFANYKKNADRENQRFKLIFKEAILRKLISHYDDLMRATEMFDFTEESEGTKQGLAIIIKNFEKLLEEEGVKRMDCVGKQFDPYKHEVLMVQESEDVPENTILEELDKGYHFNDNVLRPAKVIISKNPNLQKISENKTKIKEEDE